jgi:hypothetical protein
LRGCSPDAELAQARAGIVIGDAGFKRCSGVAHHHHVGEKRNQLMALVRKGLRPLFPGGVARKQAGIVLLQHRGAGSRRRDDEVETSKASITCSAISRVSARSPVL